MHAGEVKGNSLKGRGMSPLIRFQGSGDYQFIDILPVLVLSCKQGWFESVERVVSRFYAGWQLSLAGAKGAYDLLLKNHEPESLVRAGAAVACYTRTDFLLKYYPDPSENLFRTYSLYERVLRQSEVFGDKSAPRGEFRQELDESYFTVAEITLAVAREHPAVGLSLRSQDEWREIRRTPLSVRDATGKRLKVPARAVDRCVPGWKIGMKFFSPLIKAYALKYEAPQFLRLFEAKGKVWSTRGKKITVRQSSRILEKKLDAGFVYGTEVAEKDEKAKQLRLYLARIQGHPMRERKFSDIDSLTGSAMQSYS